jgi:hypothetical protein
MDPSIPDTLSRTRRSIDLRALDERDEAGLHDHLQQVRVNPSLPRPPAGQHLQAPSDIAGRWEELHVRPLAPGLPRRPFRRLAARVPPCSRPMQREAWAAPRFPRPPHAGGPAAPGNVARSLHVPPGPSSDGLVSGREREAEGAGETERAAVRPTSGSALPRPYSTTSAPAISTPPRPP